MKMSRPFLFVLVMFSSVSAQADYRELMREFDAYTPPPAFGAKADVVQVPPGLPADSTYETELKRVRTAMAQWERSLTRPAPDTLFYQPAAHLLESLGPARQNSSIAARRMASGFTLEVLEVLVYLRNPAIMAAQKRLRASLAAFSQVAALDEILRRYTAFTEGLMTKVGPMKGKDPLRMKFPFPGVLSLKGEVVHQAARAAREDLEAVRRDAVTSARVTFWNLIYTRKAGKITAETLGLLKYLEAVATTRYEAGKTSFQDVIQIGIKRDILAEKLVTLKEKDRTLAARLLGLADLPPNLKVGHLGDQPPSKVYPALETLYAQALERRQELRRMRAVIGKMERMIEMAETMILPPFTLNLSLYEDEAVIKVGSGAVKPTFPVSTQASTGAGLPRMPWYGADDAYLRETRQKLLGLRAKLKSTENMTLTRVRQVWFELDRAEREESLFSRRIIQRSQAALDVSMRGYESGNVTFADLILAYTIWLDAKLTREKKRSEIGIARAELEKSVGAAL